MGDSEAAGEVRGVVVPDAGADVLHAPVCLAQQPPRLGHPSLGDPLHHGAARAFPDRRGEVAGGEVDGGGHILEEDGFGIVFLYVNLNAESFLLTSRIPTRSAQSTGRNRP